MKILNKENYFSALKKFKLLSPMKRNLTSTVEPRFTNAPVHEQFGSRTNFPSKTSRMTNGVLDYEHASWQQRKLRVSARECQFAG
jgi:hypothetical protein